MQLSPNFWLHEFTFSPAAVRASLDNTPDAQQLENLSRVARSLELVRTLLGNRVITIDSGFRAPRVNALVGGVVDSYHLDGCAADFRVQGMSPFAVCLALERVKFSPIDKVIYEGTWTHLQVARPGQMPRAEFWTADFHQRPTTYSKGILT